MSPEDTEQKQKPTNGAEAKCLSVNTKTPKKLFSYKPRPAGRCLHGMH